MLHILINDESNESPELYTVFSFFDDLRIPFIQVRNNNQFDYLINYLKDETEVAIWIHPNASQRKKQNANTPGEASAIALSIHKIEFQLISRYPDGVSQTLTSRLGKTVLDLNELSVAIRTVLPIRVAKLKESSEPIAETISFYERHSNIEVAIIAALYEDEFTSLLEFIDIIEDVPGFDTMKVGTLKKSDKKVVIDFQLKMGMVESTFLSTQIVSRFSPKYLIMVGVCGGRHSKDVKLRHLLIPSKVFDYQTGKYENGTFKPYLRVCNINNKKVIKAVDAIRKSMEEYVSTPLKPYCRELKVHDKTLACGNIVVKSDGYLEQDISQYDEETQGVEMESFGVVRTTELVEDKKVKPLIIKGVMDYTEKDKNDKDKANAAFLSACFTYFLIKDHL